MVRRTFTSLRSALTFKTEFTTEFTEDTESYHRRRYLQTARAEELFWQRRFYDFNVWSHAKRKEKLHYMHANPVRERLVEHPKDWPWSSFSFCAYDEPGLIRIDPVD